MLASIHGTSSSRTLSVSVAPARISPDTYFEEKIDGIKIFPNPSSVQSKIQYQLNKQSTVSIELFNLKGTKIKNLVYNKFQLEGHYEINFNAPDQGLYVIKFVTGGNVITKQFSVQ